MSLKRDQARHLASSIFSRWHGWNRLSSVAPRETVAKPVERAGEGEDDADRMITVGDEEPDPIQEKIKEILDRGIPEPDRTVGRPGARLRQWKHGMTPDQLHEENSWETSNILVPNWADKLNQMEKGLWGNQLSSWLRPTVQRLVGEPRFSRGHRCKNR